VCFVYFTADQNMDVNKPSTLDKTGYAIEFKFTPDGISIDPTYYRTLKVNLSGSLAAIKAYLFGLLFFYSAEKPSLLEGEHESEYVNDVVSCRISEPFFYVGCDNEYNDLESVLKLVETNGKRKRYVIRLYGSVDDEISTYLLVDDIVETAQGLLAVPSDLDMQMREDLDFENCEYIDLELVNLDYLFRCGPDWSDVTGEGKYPKYKLGAISPIGDFKVEISGIERSDY